MKDGSTSMVYRRLNSKIALESPELRHQKPPVMFLEPSAPLSGLFAMNAEIDTPVVGNWTEVQVTNVTSLSPIWT